MAFEPQRFLHAANVRLDVPVSVQTSDVLTDELRLAFEDATLTSFDDVIEGCLERQVDYLLLSGNIFVEADRSLRARLALLNGFRKLEAKQIRVFVIPGDTDPAEAWRAIPEMPSNVRVCYSSDPEPVELHRNDRIIATISLSIWYGETDAFGIRVIAESPDGVQPLRIGVISEVKYAEAQRMAELAAAGSEELVAATDPQLSVGMTAEEKTAQPRARMVPLSGKPKSRRQDAVEDSESDYDESESEMESTRPDDAGETESADDEPADVEPDTDREWDQGFVRYIDETLREGRLSYLALTGELTRAILRRPDGVVHCPGTTQPRNHHEVTAGSCSLVEVNEEGRISITAVDTSSVDWKTVEIAIAARTTLSAMLQSMKTRLLQETAGPSDRIWSVHWKLRCSVPVLKELFQDDLATTVAVELDELQIAGRTIRLLHNVQLIPNAWNLDEEKLPAPRFAMITENPDLFQADKLLELIDTDKDLSAGWRQRLAALVPGLDTEQIGSHLRIDGANWFIADQSVLTCEAADEPESGDEPDSVVATADEESDDEDNVNQDTENEDNGPLLETENTAEVSSVYDDDEGDREGDSA